MTQRFRQVDVFAEVAYGGNPLAVFPDASGLTPEQMQAIATEMNLSETTFVTNVADHGYDVRIFTPREELPFAGHPTVGTAWVLRDLGRLSDGEVVQRAGGGDTKVLLAGEQVTFERAGSSRPDEERSRWEAIAAAVDLTSDDIGLDATPLGGTGTLAPALSHAGLDQLMVPVRDPEALARAGSLEGPLRRLGLFGAYCFTALGGARVRARGFFPGTGVPEDPATGSAAAALGIYLADRLGRVDIAIEQGVELGRPSLMYVAARGDRVRVGGRVQPILRGELQSLP